MDENIHNIDPFLRDKISSQEISPPSFIWDNIEEKLKKKKRKRFLLLFFSTLLFTLITVLFFFNSKNKYPTSYVKNNNIDTKDSSGLNKNVILITDTINYNPLINTGKNSISNTINSRSIREFEIANKSVLVQKNKDIAIISTKSLEEINRNNLFSNKLFQNNHKISVNVDSLAKMPVLIASVQQSNITIKEQLLQEPLKPLTISKWFLEFNVGMHEQKIYINNGSSANVGNLNGNKELTKSVPTNVKIGLGYKLNPHVYFIASLSQIYFSNTFQVSNSRIYSFSSVAYDFSVIPSVNGGPEYYYIRYKYRSIPISLGVAYIFNPASQISYSLYAELGSSLYSSFTQQVYEEKPINSPIIFLASTKGLSTTKKPTTSFKELMLGVYGGVNYNISPFLSLHFQPGLIFYKKLSNEKALIDNKSIIMMGNIGFKKSF